MTYDDMLKKLVDRESFAFSRWGDGELSCVMGAEGENCDSHQYFPDLGERLADILHEPQRYYMGLQPKAVRDMGFDLSMYFNEEGIDIDWINADLIHTQSETIGLEGLFLACKGRFAVVGPLHLQKLCQRYGLVHIIVPDRNCWKAYEHIKSKIIGTGVRNVLFCCSMLSNVLIDDCWWIWPDATLLDIGSAFSPYAEVGNRRYHSKVLARLNKEKA